MFDPKEDGITHINVYSKGKTELGRTLSNFAHTPFRIPFIGKFNSVEAYWYYIRTRSDEMRELSGVKAKLHGNKIIDTYGFNIYPEPTRRQLEIAYRAKLKAHPWLKTKLALNTLPLVHYYVYGDRVVIPRIYQWTAKLWNWLYLDNYIDYMD